MNTESTRFGNVEGWILANPFNHQIRAKSKQITTLIARRKNRRYINQSRQFGRSEVVVTNLRFWLEFARSRLARARSYIKCSPEQI